MIIDFSKYSSIKIGPKLEVAVIDRVMAFDGIIVGGANNILISPSPVKKLAMLGEEFNFVEVLRRGFLRVGCATDAKIVHKIAKEHDLGGFEFMAKIPGKIGGLLAMNAGLKGHDISKIVVQVATQMGEIGKNECEFGYRKSAFKDTKIAFEVLFRATGSYNESLEKELSQARRNQPKGHSFGSCFKNPDNDSAGRLLEAAGLKGFRRGACGFSERHANFLINYGGGEFNDAVWLIEMARRKVYSRFGVSLEPEVIII